MENRNIEYHKQTTVNSFFIRFPLARHWLRG
jgi:hypothetical protein